MVKPCGIIVLEGADCAGKTTLARTLQELLRREGAAVDYLHHGLTDDPFTLCLNALRYAAGMASARVAIIDRLWLSELAYGLTYRGQNRLGHAWRGLDRLLLKHGAVNVLCVPRDRDRQLETHARHRQERQEAYADISGAVDWYLNLWHGKTAVSGLRLFSSRPDVLRYDCFDEMNKDVENAATVIIKELAEARHNQLAAALNYDNTNFAGHLGMADVVIVGEDLSPRAAYHPWPWFWPNDLSGAAGFFNSILDDVDFQEGRGLFINARQAPDMLAEVVKKRLPLRYVALGKIAATRLGRLGISFTELRHPQFVKRFHQEQIPQYIEEVRDALRA